MNYSSKNRGFTITELIVVISIATVLMTVLLIQQDKWSDRLTVNTQAYELALMIRQAQVYSLGVREDTAGSGDKFDVGYGIHLDQDHLNQYIFFADRDKDERYDSPGELIEIKTFTRGVTIKDVCSTIRCFPGIGPLYQVDILFFRPETKAIISLLNSGGNPYGDAPPVTIRLQSAGGKISSVKVEANGQVSITQ